MGKIFFEKLEHWMYYNDDPVSDPSALALMILAEEVHRAGYKVMLAGEGADELFGGYNSYLRFTLFHRLSRWHVSVLAGRVSNLFSFRDADYLENLAQPVFQGTAHISSARLRAEIITGVSAAWNDSSVSAEVQSFTPLRQAMIVDQLIRLPNDLLMRTDRATMAYAVETRVPYLDKKVIAYANAFRDADCARLFSGQSKIWLKQLAATHIAKKNIYRPKMGFDLPIGAWLRGPLRELIRTCLREQKIPGICYENMERLYVIQHQKSNRYTPVIWAWLILEMWYRNWILKKITRPYWPH